MANAASHALACALPLLAWPALAAAAPPQRALGVAAVAVFCITMVLVFLASAITTRCRTAPNCRRARWTMRRSTSSSPAAPRPSTLGAMTGWSGWAGIATCALLWLLALAGAALKLMRRLTQRRLSTGLYLLLGWCAALAALPGVALDASALARLLAGGAAYLVGTAFFVFDTSLRFGHFIWHLFVMAGSGCHLAAALA